MDEVKTIAFQQNNNNNIRKNQKREWVTKCPTKVYEYDKTSGKVVVANPNNCTYTMECVEKAEEMGFPGLVSVREKETSKGKHEFIFTVEVCCFNVFSIYTVFQSTGSLKPEEIVSMAFDVVLKKLERVQSEIQKLYTTNAPQ